MSKKQEYLENWESLKSEEEQTKPKEESGQVQASNLYRRRVGTNPYKSTLPSEALGKIRSGRDPTQQNLSHYSRLVQSSLQRLTIHVLPFEN